MRNDTGNCLALRAHLKTLVVCTTGVMTLAATTTGYTRSTGSFIDDGFQIGMEVTPAGFSANPSSVILDVTDTALIVADARAAQTAATGRSLTVALPSARQWDNPLSFTPPGAAPYIEEDYVPQPPVLRGMTSGGIVQVKGLYIIRWYGLTNSPRESLTRPSDAILELFKPGVTAITNEDGDVVRAGENPMPWASPIVKVAETQRPVITITVPHYLYTTNS